MGKGGVIATVVALAALLAPGGLQSHAAAQVEADPARPASAGGGSTPRLTFLGGRKRRAVPLRLDGATKRAGRLSLVVRNLSPATGRLRLRFFPNRGRGTVLVGPRRRNAGPVRALWPTARRVTMRPGDLRDVELAFEIGRTQRVSRVSGVLVADLIVRGEASAPHPARMRIRGASPPVRMVPAKAVLQVTRACGPVDWGPLGWDCGREAHVLIRGDHALSMLERQGVAAHTILANGEGGQVTVRLERPERLDNAVRATVVADDVDDVGDFAGRLPLAPGGKDVAMLPVAVSVGDPLWLAILLVFSGSFVGGFLARRSGIRRKRRLLGMQVETALERYDAELRAGNGKAAGYDLEPFVQPRHKGRRSTALFPGHHGVSGLLWAIDTAQDDDDFDEASEKTQDFVCRIDRWVGMEPIARQTRALIDDVPPAREDLDFADCMAFGELESIIEELRSTEPANDAEAEKVRRELSQQAEVLGRWKVLWGLHRAIEEHGEWSDEDHARIEAADYPSLDGLTPPRPREPRDHAQLMRRLGDAERKLRKLVEREGLSVPAECAEAEELVEKVQTEAAKPAIAPTMAESHVFRRGLGGIVLRDYLWTLGRALAAVIAYTLTFYDDTWGTATDYATAFTTGFLTETIVNWAVMPAFQSYQTRKRKKAEQEGLTDKALAGIDELRARLPGAAPNGAGDETRTDSGVTK